MSKSIFFSKKEVHLAKQLRDHATTINEYRKALSVILVAEHNINVEQTAELLGISRRTVFRNREEIRNQDCASQGYLGDQSMETV
jgi:transcriptional regulator of acetoin/glycerol metabolism